MTELTKGFSTSGLLHGLLLVAFLVTTWHPATAGRGNTPLSLKYGAQGADPSVISTPPPEPAADPITDVSDLAPDPKDLDNPFIPEPATTPEIPVGMEILNPRDLRKNPPKTAAKKPPLETPKDKPPKAITEATRLQQIRQRLLKPSRPRPVLARNTGTTANLDKEAIRSRLGNQIKNDVVAVQVGGGSANGTSLLGGGGSGGRGDQFMSAISAVLHDAWQQPTRAEVGQANPNVGVKLTIHADGSISDFGIVKGSGNAAMDDSVNALFRTLKKLPPLTRFGISAPVLTLKVAFTLDPE